MDLEDLLANVPPRLPPCGKDTGLKKTTMVRAEWFKQVTITPAAGKTASIAFVADPYSPHAGWLCINPDEVADPTVTMRGQEYYMANPATVYPQNQEADPGVANLGQTFNMVPFVRDVFEGLLTDYTFNDQASITGADPNWAISTAEVPRGPYVAPGMGLTTVTVNASLNAIVTNFPVGSATAPQVFSTLSGTRPNNDANKLDSVMYCNNKLFRDNDTMLAAVSTNLQPEIVMGGGQGAQRVFTLGGATPGKSFWFIPGSHTSDILSNNNGSAPDWPQTLSLPDGSLVYPYVWTDGSAPGSFWTFAPRMPLDDRLYSATIKEGIATVTDATADLSAYLAQRTGMTSDSIGESCDHLFFATVSGGPATFVFDGSRNFGFSPEPHGPIARMGVAPFPFHQMPNAEVSGCVGSGQTRVESARDRIVNAAVANERGDHGIPQHIFHRAVQHAGARLNAASTTGLVSAVLPTAGKIQLPTQPLSDLASGAEHMLAGVAGEAVKAASGVVKSLTGDAGDVASSLPVIGGLAKSAASIAEPLLGLFGL